MVSFFLILGSGEKWNNFEIFIEAFVSRHKGEISCRIFRNLVTLLLCNLAILQSYNLVTLQICLPCIVLAWLLKTFFSLLVKFDSE